MKTKQEILVDLQDGLRAGVLTEGDLKAFMTTQSIVTMRSNSQPERKHEKLSAVDSMFYIAGIVLFSTIMSIIGQSWNDSNGLVHILLSAVLGMVLWSIAYYLIKRPLHNDIRKGLTNALLLTGSLLMIVGGFIITYEIIGDFSEINYIVSALALIILGGIHIGFDRLIKRDLTLLIGIFLVVSAFPTLLFGILQDSDVTADVWSIIVIISSGLLIYTTRVIAKLDPSRKRVHSSFDSFGGFIALMTMYLASYGDYGVLWLCVLAAAVFGIFYLSIVLQNKQLLGNGSFFMVLTIITISVKYFSGYGVTFSLIIATLGLLGSAAVASSINKKYFQQSAPTTPPSTIPN